MPKQALELSEAELWVSREKLKTLMEVDYA